jgi:mannose-6-phosphate isomerase-like protein (cupin superfamily)
MKTESSRIAVIALVLCAAVTMARASAIYAGQANEMITVNPQTLKFAQIPGIPSCATAAPMRGDPSKGPFALLLKLSAGCRVPWHWHTPNEEVLVVSGAGVLDVREGKPFQMRPGAYASLPSHHVHQATCSSACVLFNTADGIFDIHYVDESGTEIPADEALKKKAASGAAKTK